jgi:hypothetical protein
MVEDLSIYIESGSFTDENNQNAIKLIAYDEEAGG